MLFGINRDVTAVSLAGHGVCFLEHGPDPRHIEVLVHQFKKMLDLHHRRLEYHVLDERNEPGFLDFLVEERNHVGIRLADNVMIDVVHPVDLFYRDIIMDGAINPPVMWHVGHGFTIKILGPELYFRVQAGDGAGGQGSPSDQYIGRGQVVE